MSAQDDIPAELAAAINREFQRWSFPVEAGKIREFAKAVGATDAIHFDKEAAAAAGFRDLVAPPTFSTASAHWSPPDSGVSELGLDFRRVLAGGGTWHYYQPLVAGDVIEVQGRVTNVTRKRGGKGGMSVISVQNSYVRDGELVQVYDSAIMLLDAAPADRRGDEQ